LPVVAPDSGGIREIVSLGRTGGYRVRRYRDPAAFAKYLRKQAGEMSKKKE
jgi:hypothetical protein